MGNVVGDTQEVVLEAPSIVIRDGNGKERGHVFPDGSSTGLFNGNAISVAGPSGDATGATDSAALASAIALNAINNLPIVLQAGIYKVNQQVTLARDYMMLTGATRGRTTIQAVAPMNAVVQVNGVVEATLQDFQLDGGGLASHELDLQHSEGTARHLIQRVRVKGNVAAPVNNTAADGSVTSGQTAFTSATGVFTANDVGKWIIVTGAGPAGVNLMTTIAAFVSATAVTLTDAAGTTVTTSTYQYWGAGFNNIGCEDVTWLKCGADGSEASPQNLTTKMVISTPNGLQNMYGCDIFGPVFHRVSGFTIVGGNVGPLVCMNGAGTQSLQLTVQGAWIYDGGSPTNYMPIDAAATFICATSIENCHLVAALTATAGWVNGRLPSNNSVRLKENLYVQSAGNTNASMTLFTTSTGTSNTAVIVDGGSVSIGGSMTSLRLNSGGSASHTVALLKKVQGVSTYTNIGTNFTTPAVPATGVAQVNLAAVPMAVSMLSGGATVSAIAVNGTTVGTGLSATDPATVIVPPMGTITLTYTVATPTWVWIAL